MYQLNNKIDCIEKQNNKIIQQLNRIALPENYLKNQHLLEYGQRCHKLWYLKSGMIRRYCIQDGKEITLWLYTENEIFTELQSFSRLVPSKEYIQACENSEVISISRNDYLNLRQNPEMWQFCVLLIENMFVDINQHMRNMHTKDARAKYEYLRDNAPEIIKRAKLGHIASMLGISQETLSRIRKR
ncbi:Crp/Fnr family transcriptional regulator [uncultured Draconibacterium sp.]|uniref:Crp/Fnr family transcriptional regulator n=1 Tax=uncultured Draconibacterium sp. TaxID=1573823 RepID=UPI002AA710AF|nr:Crp/Fnr family transcriptional regulator [uncultured Draconibacterium sp.]